jgi:hypothetical protein
MEQGFPWEVPRIYQRVKPWVLEGFLTPYQREAWAWLYNRGEDGSNLWWACGSGKTLAALLFLVSGPEKEKKVIVTRATTKRQWQREAAQYTNLKLRVLSGKSFTPISPDEEAVVLSWEILPAWYEALVSWAAGSKLAVVYDEIHKGKSHKRKEKYVNLQGNYKYRWLNNRVACAARLSKVSHRRLGLTATPIRDRRSDLWGQLDLVQPDRHGTSWDWTHHFCDAHPGLYGGLDTTGTSNCEELKSILSNIVHAVSYKEMATALPQKRRQLIYLPFEDQYRAVAMRKELKQAAKRGPRAVFETRMLLASAYKRTWISSAVRDAVEAKQKVVIFTGRRKDAESLYRSLDKKIGSKTAGLKYGKPPMWCGHGGHSVASREEMVQEYAECEGPAVFVGTHDAFGEAIDGLQHTDLVYFSLLPWTPGQVTQAEGRFSRHGSDRPVLISYIIAEGTVDEHVADILLEKLEAVAGTLNDKEAQQLADTLSGVDNEEEIINSILEVSFGAE